MNCYDCTEATTTPAVAVCCRCGAAACRRHLDVAPAEVRLPAAPGPATRPHAARRAVCLTCHAAETG